MSVLCPGMGGQQSGWRECLYWVGQSCPPPSGGVTSLEPCSWHCKIEAQELGVGPSQRLRHWDLVLFAGRVQETARSLKMIEYYCTTASWLVSSYSLIRFGLWAQFSTSGTLHPRQIHWSSKISFPTLRRLFYENDSLKVLEVTDGWSIYVVMMWMDRLMRYGGHILLHLHFEDRI